MDPPDLHRHPVGEAGDETFEFFQRILVEIGCRLRPAATVLDLGCGDGGLTVAYRERGYRAVGVDVAPYYDRTASDIVARGLADPDEPVFQLIDMDHYRLPFDDASIDCVVSNQVLEHAQNLDELLAEVSRVLRPDGMSLNVFPSKFRPVEAHTLVPLGGAVRGRAWLQLWARLGIRNRFQQDLPAGEVARVNHRWLRSSTHYPSARTIRRAAKQHFERVVFAELPYMRHSFGKARWAYWPSRLLPPLRWLVRALHIRVLVLAGPKPRPD